MERAETLEEIKKTVSQIDMLKDAVWEIDNRMEVDSVQLFLKSIGIELYKVDLERNTEVLLKESYERFIQEAKKLLENEIGERMKKLNVHS